MKCDKRSYALLRKQTKEDLIRNIRGLEKIIDQDSANHDILRDSCLIIFRENERLRVELEKAKK